MTMRVSGSYRVRNSVARARICCLRFWGVCDLVAVAIGAVV